MTAEIISVGTELLLGDIVNTNAAYLARQCAHLGLSVYYQSVVGDNAGRLKAAIQQAMERSDVIFLGGGLGPTEDDLTKETAAEVLGRTLYEDAHTRKRVEEFFVRIGRTPTENNWKQALVPEDALILDNDNGSAPGLMLEEGSKVLILLPGPPNEMIPLFQQYVYPYLKKKGSQAIVSRTLKVCSVGESRAEMQIKDLIHAYTNPTIATYAKTGEVHIRVTARAQTEEEAEELLLPVVQEIRRRFGKHVFTDREEETLEEVVAGLLKKHQFTIASAESCTGGLLSGRLVNVSGVSEVFQQGFITYSNSAKRDLLGVKEDTLLNYGAVSKETAGEMARGAARVSGAEVGVSVTGIAGPEGGTEEKPVGLVYIGCDVCGETVVRECHFTGNRAKIRESSAAAALVLVRNCILALEEA